MSRSETTASVTITVKYLSVLRDQAGLRQEAVAFPEGSRLSDLAHWIEEHHGFRYGDRGIMFILNGRGWGQYPQGLHTPLREGDTVLLSMPVSGG
jgi:molybdopterin converting factor small subunit